MCSKFYCQNLWNHHYNKLCYIFTDHSNGWSLIYYWNVNILKGIFYWIQHWGVYIYTFLKDHFKYIKVFQKNTFICTYSLSIEQIKYDRYIKKTTSESIFFSPLKKPKTVYEFLTWLLHIVHGPDLLLDLLYASVLWFALESIKDCQTEHSSWVYRLFWWLALTTNPLNTAGWSVGQRFRVCCCRLPSSVIFCKARLNGVCNHKSTGYFQRDVRRISSCVCRQGTR